MISEIQIIRLSFELMTTEYDHHFCSRYEQESKVQFVVDAVYAFAYALHNLYEDLCKNYTKPGICPAMTQYDGGDFYKKYLLNVSFKGKKGSAYNLFLH